jgi:hypothetical protein
MAKALPLFLSDEEKQKASADLVILEKKPHTTRKSATLSPNNFNHFGKTNN